MDRTLIIKFDARTIIIVGAVLVMLAAWLPWSSLPSFLVGDLARRGFSAGGLFTLALAVLAVLGLLLPWRPLRRVSLLAAILAVLIDLVALVAFAQGVQLSTGLEIDLGAQLSSPGSGLYLTFAGSWLMLFGGLADAEPAPDRSWLSYATWGGMLGVLLAACLCAWSIGLIARPVTLVSVATPTATFGPAPTVYLATPLVDVQLEPLGKPGAPPPAAPTLNRPGNLTPPPTSAAIPPSPTARRSSPTPPPSPSATFALPALPTPTGSPTLAVPTLSPPTPTPVTPTPFTSPLKTPTASPTITPTVTVTPTTTSTVTPTVTPGP